MKSSLHYYRQILTVVLLFLYTTIQAQTTGNKLPYDDPAFTGKIGKTYKDSEASMA
ncbi:hypothetical protein ACQ9BO_15630 [Flavobacterium sp. P21]|uniref:hypothetical protein n=1 Tax=Flavobacterium sp. P21 TaxID=3423948 RepID=UPI003D666594